MTKIYTIILWFTATALFGQVGIQEIQNTSINTNQQFGESVSISDDFAIVGAHYGDDQSGSVYVYKRNASEWSFHSEIKPSSVEEGDWFGAHVDISGDRMVVGAPSDFWSEEKTGKIYLFKLEEDVWIEDTIVKPSSNAFLGSGYGLLNELSDDKLFVSVMEFFNSTGTVLYYNNISDTWNVDQIINAPSGYDIQNFGRSISTHENWLFISGLGFSSDGFVQVIFVYRSVNGEWEYRQAIEVPGSHNQVLVPSKTMQVVGDELIVGNHMPMGQYGGLGGVYNYKLVDESWELVQDVNIDEYEKEETGIGVCRNERVAIVGVNQIPGPNEPHRILVYDTYSSDNWTLLEDFGFEEDGSLSFGGFAMDISDNYAILGNDFGTGQHGVAYVLDFTELSALPHVQNENTIRFTNPVRNDLNIWSGQKINEIKLYTIDGKSVYHQNEINQKVIHLNLDQVQAGQFVVAFRINDKWITDKLVVIK